MIVAKESPHLEPLCPHCGVTLSEIHGRGVSARARFSFGFGKRYIYACPSCRKVLGVSHRKGFWAG